MVWPNGRSIGLGWERGRCLSPHGRAFNTFQPKVSAHASAVQIHIEFENCPAKNANSNKVPRTEMKICKSSAGPSSFRSSRALERQER